MASSGYPNIDGDSAVRSQAVDGQTFRRRVGIIKDIIIELEEENNLIAYKIAKTRRRIELKRAALEAALIAAESAKNQNKNKSGKEENRRSFWEKSGPEVNVKSDLDGSRSRTPTIPNFSHLHPHPQTLEDPRHYPNLYPYNRLPRPESPEMSHDPNRRESQTISLEEARAAFAAHTAQYGEYDMIKRRSSEKWARPDNSHLVTNRYSKDQPGKMRSKGERTQSGGEVGIGTVTHERGPGNEYQMVIKPTKGSDHDSQREDSYDDY